MEARLELADEARRAFDWIGSIAVDVDGGLGWLEGGVLVDDLYSGTAGVLVGCAEAAAAGLGTAQVSAGARARLLQLAHHGPGVATLPDDGLFSGWAGVAVALRAWSRVAGDAAAASAAGQVTSQIAGRILQAPADRPQCTDVISGDAGILLALIADDSDAAVRAAHVLAGWQKRPNRARAGSTGGWLPTGSTSCPGSLTVPPGSPTPWPRPAAR